MEGIDRPSSSILLLPVSAGATFLQSLSKDGTTGNPMMKSWGLEAAVGWFAVDQDWRVPCHMLTHEATAPHFGPKRGPTGGHQGHSTPPVEVRTNCAHTTHLNGHNYINLGSNIGQQ